MFKYTLDTKTQIKDPNDNYIVDLTTSIFNLRALQIQDYSIKRIDSYFNMRPDLVSVAEYGNIENAEYILKFSGISNPFTLCEDDVLMIPNESGAYGMMKVNNPEVEEESTTESKEAQIRNYFKFVNRDYKSDSTSYDNLANREIKSAVLNSRVEKPGVDYMVPYISEDGRTSVTIRNGKMFFGEDAGLRVASTIDLNEKIQSIINNTATALSDSNCMYNGTKLADFVRANYKQNS